MARTSKEPAAAPGPGRPKLAAGKAMVNVSVSVTPAQKDMLARMAARNDELSASLIAREALDLWRSVYVEGNAVTPPEQPKYLIPPELLPKKRKRAAKKRTKKSEPAGTKASLEPASAASPASANSAASLIDEESGYNFSWK